MIYRVSCKSKNIEASIPLTASKSESNRALIIFALSNQSVLLENISDSEDTLALQNAIDTIHSSRGPIHINIGAAGTTMRFLTAYAAQLQGKECILSGTERMHERPIKELVNVLRSIGADICYLDKEGYPPVRIKGKKLNGGKVSVEAGISSQFISALLMIAPTLENGLHLELKGEIASAPYIRMTLNMMNASGIAYTIVNDGRTIIISPQIYQPHTFKIGADWSSASYWYLIALFSNTCRIELLGLKNKSSQGDSIVASLFEPLGVKTTYLENSILLEKESPDIDANKTYELNLSDCPDLAQTIAVAYAAKGVSICLKGLKTLRIKETDRISALISELSKIGVKATCNEKDELFIHRSSIHQPSTTIETFEDHRMAMSFAPLALCFDYIEINDPLIVKKSYPGFWNDLKKVGFTVHDQ